MLSSETGWIDVGNQREQHERRDHVGTHHERENVMRKFVVIGVAAFVGFFGGIPAHASPTPAECAESDTAPPGCPIDGNNYPLVNPDGGTVPDTVPPPTNPPVVTTPPPGLPATGSSGSAVLLQIGAMCVVGGMIVFVAARRRSTPTAPA